MRHTSDFDGNGAEIAAAGLGYRTTGETGSDDALKDPLAAELDQTTPVLKRNAGGDAGTGWTAINLGIGEDAGVGGGIARIGVSPIGKDGAVEEGEIVVVGMVMS